jgi:hypothetical protein
MRSKWFKRIKRFIEQFTPGGTEYTSFGTEIHYSRDGVTTISRSDAHKLLLMRLDEWEKQRTRMRTDPDQQDVSGG